MSLIILIILYIVIVAAVTSAAVSTIISVALYKHYVNRRDIMTNEQLVREQIAEMPTEELAKLICHAPLICANISTPCRGSRGKDCHLEEPCHECTLRWMKKEAKI